MRKWFGHQPERFDEFRRHYINELSGHRDRLAELLGDPGAARRFGQSVAGGGGALRKVQQYTQSCWDVYQRLVLQASYQLESCIASFAVYNPLRQVCAAVWILQVESAWFQFLSCSAIPLK